MATINCAKRGQALTPEQTGSPCPVCGSVDRDLSAQEQAVLREKIDVAKELAKKHYSIEPCITQIFTIWDKPKYEALPSTPIKLLEVNEATVASGVMPLHFGPVPASGIPFPSIIIEVTPAEFEKIKAGELKLPNGWVIGEELPGG